MPDRTTPRSLPQATRFAPWMCPSCGYAMDAASECTGGADVPREGDMACCLNCGAPQLLEGGAWRPMRDADWRSLTPEERRQLTLAMLAQRLAKPQIGDLTKGEGSGKA